MKIGVISRKRSIYSTRRMMETIKDAGHSVVLINPERCQVIIDSHQPRLFAGKKVIEGLDLVFARIGTIFFEHGIAVAEYFQSHGIPVINPPESIILARDKIRSLQILSAHKVPVPKSATIRSLKNLRQAIKSVGGPPVVLKLSNGMQGNGVTLSETIESAESMLGMLWGWDRQVMIQHYIAESRGIDIRIFVIGDSITAAMKRIARKKEFRSNIHRGGTGHAVELTTVEKQIALKSVHVLGLKVGGVDIIRSEQGAVVVEVNGTPGFKGLEKTTGADIASAILNYGLSCVKSK